MELDLVEVEGRRIELGEPLEDVKMTWRDHGDLQLPWHYFAKQTGSLVVDVPTLAVLRCPVTWGQLGDVLPDLVAARKPPGAGGDHPADDLTFDEAHHAAGRIAERCHIALRLPTEAEWEHLARGPEDRRYPWGDRFDASCANLAEAGVGHTEPVGSRPAGASAAGVLDLAGNVDEWTSSRYAPFPGAHWTVPATETWSVDPHVTRGGSFAHHRDLALARRRHAIYRPWVGAGFRLVVEVA